MSSLLKWLYNTVRADLSRVAIQMYPFGVAALLSLSSIASAHYLGMVTPKAKQIMDAFVFTPPTSARDLGRDAILRSFWIGSAAITVSVCGIAYVVGSYRIALVIWACGGPRVTLRTTLMLIAVLSASASIFAVSVWTNPFTIGEPYCLLSEHTQTAISCVPISVVFSWLGAGSCAATVVVLSMISAGCSNADPELEISDRVIALHERRSSLRAALYLGVSLALSVMVITWSTWTLCLTSLASTPSAQAIRDIIGGRAAMLGVILTLLIAISYVPAITLIEYEARNLARQSLKSCDMQKVRTWLVETDLMDEFAFSYFGRLFLGVSPLLTGVVVPILTSLLKK